MGTGAICGHESRTGNRKDVSQNVESDKDSNKHFQSVSSNAGTNESENVEQNGMDSKNVEDRNDITTNSRSINFSDSGKSALLQDLPQEQKPKSTITNGVNSSSQLKQYLSIETGQIKSTSKREDTGKGQKENEKEWEALRATFQSRLKCLINKNKDTIMLPGTEVTATNTLRSYFEKEITSTYAEKNTKLESLRQEKKRLLHRLSELASARLRHNNPDIADLSDENRATKLAEKLSELYDNEWTDLFEATRHQIRKGKVVEERSIAECLRDVLLNCYQECKHIVVVQRDCILSCLQTITCKDFQNSPQRLQMQIKEFQKKVPQYVLPSIMETNAKSAQEKLKDNIVIKFSKKKTRKQFEPYIKLCTEISWYTQIQDPPLQLDFGLNNLEASHFRPYTSSGPKLDFVLWPALLLHVNGSVVAKGVAQFTTESEMKCESSLEAKPTTSAIEKKKSKMNMETAQSEW